MAGARTSRPAGDPIPYLTAFVFVGGFSRDGGWIFEHLHDDTKEENMTKRTDVLEKNIYGGERQERTRGQGSMAACW